mmetsp:Transcript_30161/g.48705  ORF Transcript_30161/g.48705 Transcript_30161/m.48705 type:complete len:253 (+) Transcript_30161:232-990(+)|eukprot:CAMPEP_0184664736 /NCGR_PEP_ID=MMETSP0308-20130426/54188_1 /TAXON_ID=38269 /ORGANISM="Gloeochaete witrockiana, Strain SAG 46.84" /LENGTH=252 /DNA_ID=CAMNT_0027108321 /DNA_START=210 /DNA_END=968 /DNA_ORIENTATION=-
MVDMCEKENAGETLITPASSDLTPLGDPAEQAKVFEDSIRTNDWQAQFIAITGLRALALFHAKDAEIATSLRTCLATIVSLVNSLRSQLAKNAILCIADMFAKFEIFFSEDPSSLRSVLKVLLTKACQEKKFIREEAQKALEIAASSRGNDMVLMCLLELTAEKNPHMVAKIASCTERCLQEMNGQLDSFPDVPRLVAAVVQFVQGKVAETRTSGKSCLGILVESLGREELVKQLTEVSPSNVRLALTIIDS